MKILYYPDPLDDTNEGGPIRRFIKNLSKERPPKLWNLVKDVFEKVENAENLDFFIRNSIVKRLGNVGEPIFEFRIPPGKKKGGVVRIYFCYQKDNSNNLILLSAEKKEESSANQEKIDQAIRRYREIQT